MNIRLAHEQKEIAGRIIKYLYHARERTPLNTLIISPPGVGKDNAAQRIPYGCYRMGHQSIRAANVGVIDERGEIAGAYRGSAMLDCGERTDVITGGDKQQGISILVRTLHRV